MPKVELHRLFLDMLGALDPYLPCGRDRAIATLALKTGKNSKYIRKEVIEPLIEFGFLVEDVYTLRLTRGEEKCQ